MQRLKIGLEVHAQLAAKHKLFSPAPISNSEQPNVDVHPLDMAYPGFLPILNRECVDLAVRAALVLDCRLNRESFFDRKHYDYHDLPSGYQITQERRPIAEMGRLEGVSIRRLQLEQDTAKTMAATMSSPNNIMNTPDRRDIDLNRAGVGLLEIVTDPTLYEAEQAVSFAKSLRHSLKDAAICHGCMESGQLRFDVNVSLIDGLRVEVKNLNSFAHLREAIEYEHSRQKAVLEGNGRIERETRGWDPRSGMTVPLRLKQPDYRFMPEYDLPSLVIGEEEIERQRALLPEPRQDRLDRWTRLGITPSQVEILLNHDLASVFERATKAEIPAQLAANWLTVDYLGVLGRASQPALSDEQLFSLLKAMTTTELTAYAAKGVLVGCLWHNQPFAIPIAASLDWQKMVQAEVERQPERVAEIIKKQRSLDYFMGPLMRRLRGAVEPAELRSFLASLILTRDPTSSQE